MVVRLSLTLILLAGCSSKTGSGDAPVFNNSNPTYREKRLATIRAASSIVKQNAATFSTELTALNAAIEAWDNDPSDETLADARTTFTTTMLAWQKVESLEFGPIAPTSAPGGSDLRDEIYSWPTVNLCRVDQELVAKTYEDASAFAGLLVNARGLDALEHLLWHPGENACPPQTDINADGLWANVDDLDVRRPDYAVAVVNDLVTRNGELNSALDAFATTLESEAPNELFANEQEALNAVFGALLYLDTDVKDLKVGRPLGIIDCADALCLDDRELKASENSLTSIHANLTAWHEFGFGPDGFGVLLAEVGASDITDDINQAYDSAIAIASRDATLATLATDDATEATALFDHIKAINDRLKTDFAATLSLDLPQTADGDND